MVLDELHGTALGLDLEALSPAHLKTVIVGRDRFDHGLRRMLDEGIRNGAFRPADAKLLSFAMLGAVNWIPRWYNPDGPVELAGDRRRFADYLDRRAEARPEPSNAASRLGGSSTPRFGRISEPGCRPATRSLNR